MVPLIQELKSIIRSKENWSLLVDDQQEKVFMESKKSVRGFTILRASGVIDYPVLDVWRCFEYLPFKNQWDLNLQEFKYLSKVGVNAFIACKTIKGKGTLQPRDFLVNMLTNIEADGSIVLVSSSLSCDYKYPEQPGVTRGDTPISGCVF
jgi:hypothetical protein